MPAKIKVFVSEHVRELPAIVFEWRCAICGQYHSKLLPKGSLRPKYCPFPSDCQRIANIRRVRKYQAKKRKQKQE